MFGVVLEKVNEWRTALTHSPDQFQIAC